MASATGARDPSGPKRASSSAKLWCMSQIIIAASANGNGKADTVLGAGGTTQDDLFPEVRKKDLAFGLAMSIVPYLIGRVPNGNEQARAALLENLCPVRIDPPSSSAVFDGVSLPRVSTLSQEDPEKVGKPGP